MSHIIDIKNVTKVYGKNFVALDNLSFQVEKGRIIGLLGPNGAGKTTLIKILTGLIKNYSGEVLIDGHPIGIESKKIVAYLPDMNFITPEWTVKYAVNYYKDFFDDFDEVKADSLFRSLGINVSATFKSLSKGNKEKVQLILTLSRKAKIYIFDEPIAGVDPAARDLIFDLIVENCQKDATIIISTHLISDAEKIIDYFLFLKRGVIVRQGDVKTIRENTNKSIDDLFREDFRCLRDF